MDEPEKDWNELQLWFLKTCWSKDVVTRDDSQRRFLAQHSVTTLLLSCFEWLQYCSNI